MNENEKDRFILQESLELYSIMEDTLKEKKKRLMEELALTYPERTGKMVLMFWKAGLSHANLSKFCRTSLGKRLEEVETEEDYVEMTEFYNTKGRTL